MKPKSLIPAPFVVRTVPLTFPEKGLTAAVKGSLVRSERDVSDNVAKKKYTTLMHNEFRGGELHYDLSSSNPLQRIASELPME